jgi:putative DNA primase/helicase
MNAITHPAPGASIADWAHYYVATCRFSLVPMEPGSKAPRGKGWNQPGGYFTEAGSAEIFWHANPQHGLGLLHSASLTCALDLDHPQAWLAF